MGTTIGSNNPQIHSTQTPAAVTDTKKIDSTASAKEQTPTPAEAPALKKAAQKQGKEASSLQSLSGTVRSQDLNEQLNQANQSTGPKLQSGVLTPQKEAEIKYYKLDKQIEDLSKKILDLQKELDKAPKKAKAAIKQQIEKGTQKLGELILEQEQVAKKMSYDPKVLKRMQQWNHDMAMDMVRKMR